MLNALEVGTHVPIHRHLKISETVVVLRDVWIGFSMRSFLGLIQVGRCIMGKRQRMKVVL